MTMTVILSVIAGLAVGVLIGFMYQKNASDKKYKGALSESERVISEAVKKAEQMKRDIVSEGKEEIHRLRQELDRTLKNEGMNCSVLKGVSNKKKRTLTGRSKA